ncbi:hypothetical protein BDR04DRAFT_1122330 [Suillus decipiens]|nr:hypothetical protein BDR04DRAFT_1122330 [Suillus decipiens]
MTRPRLYSTPQEKLEAAHHYHKTYYDRNHAIISSKCKEKYRAQQHANAAPQLEEMADLAVSSIINGHSSTELLDQLVQDFWVKGTTAIDHWIQSIETLLMDVDALRQQVQEYHCVTLQSHSVGKELSQVEFTAGRVTSLTKALEDILMHAMVDLHTLFDHHAQGMVTKTQEILIARY